MYSVASERLASLQKSAKKKKYRSYWIDCIRTFELVERKYPKSSYAAKSCFERASLYSELYKTSRYPRDLDTSIKTYWKCESSHPNHEKAPEALYKIVDLSVRYETNKPEASKAFSRLSESYASTQWAARAKSRLGIEPKKDNSKPVSRKSGSSARPGMINNIRFWSGGAYTRVVIDESKPVTFKAYELKAPDRLVFDLENAQMSDSINNEPIAVNDGILKQVRTSQFERDTVRVVLDLASIKSYVVFPLHDPARLVIDVTGEKTGNTSDEGQKSEPGSGAGGEQRSESDSPVIIPPVKMPGIGNSESQNLSLSSQLGLKVRTIAIDAGHGGHDPGAIGRSGLKEKNISLDIAKRLAVLVRDRLGCNVVMTRDKDVFIPLEQRPFIAKSKDADLFVSIHVNASRKRKTRGIETYIQGLNASDRDAMATAARENSTSTKKLSELDSELEKILKGLSMQSADIDSVKLAHSVQNSLVDTMKPVQGQVVNLGVKRAFFYVLINTEMPSILAEVGFISNPTEEKLLKQESYRQSIAEALFEGVKKYVDARTPQMMGI